MHKGYALLQLFILENVQVYEILKEWHDEPRYLGTGFRNHSQFTKSFESKMSVLNPAHLNPLSSISKGKGYPPTSRHSNPTEKLILIGPAVELQL